MSIKHSPAGWGIALLGVSVVVVAVIAFVLVRQSKAPAATEHRAAPIAAIATWKAGVRRAPGFRSSIRAASRSPWPRSAVGPS